MEEKTIYDIAQEAGVSAATVSRVINNYPYVSKATRDKVNKLLKECHYVPNETARSLVTQSSKMVGILIADVRTTHHTDGVYYIEHEFSKKGYSCLIYNTGTNEENQAKYIQLLSQRKIDAVVLMGSIYQNGSVKKAISTYIPSVPVAICNGYLEGENIYGVLSNEKEGVYNAVKLLSEKCHKNIAFLLNHTTPSNEEKVNGFNSGFSEFIKKGEKVVKITGDTIEEIKESTKEAIKNYNLDAIIYAEDFMALVGLKAISELKLKIPEDIAVMGINNSKFAPLSIPSLSSIDNMLYDTSLTSVRNLLAVLSGEHENHKMIIASEIVEREST